MARMLALVFVLTLGAGRFGLTQVRSSGGVGSGIERSAISAVAQFDSDHSDCHDASSQATSVKRMTGGNRRLSVGVAFLPPANWSD